MKLFGEKRLVKSVKLLPLSIKSINPIQKQSHIIESYAGILKIFVAIVDTSINILFYFEICSTENYQNKWNYYSVHTRFIIYVPSFILLGKLSLE